MGIYYCTNIEILNVYIKILTKNQREKFKFIFNKDNVTKNLINHV